MGGIPPRRRAGIQGPRGARDTPALHFPRRRCTIRTTAPLLPALLLLLLLCGCPTDGSGVAPGDAWLDATGLPHDPAEPAPDFSLEDVNATSATFGQVVSPRDHLEQVSGWYFGHST